MSRAAIRKELHARTPEERTPEEARSAKDAADVALAEEAEAERKENDLVGEPLNWSAFVLDQNVAQCFGQAVIDDNGGDVSALPKWRFRRRYLGVKVIVDLFQTRGQYEAAQVEERRKMCSRYGFRYAALGPDHSVYPIEDKARRAKFPSLIEQLGIGQK